MQEILDVGNDPEELHAKTQSLREEIERLEKRVREALFTEGDAPAGGEDLDVAAVVNGLQGGR